MAKQGGKKQKILSVFITVVILAVLLIAGPANALTVSMSVSDSTITTDESTTITVNVDIEAGDSLPANTDYTLSIDGSNCTITLSNTTCGITGVSSITVEDSRTSYAQGYGYGYGYGSSGSSYSVANYSLGYGYGYGYSSAVTNDLVFTISYSPSSTGTKTASFYVNTPNGVTFKPTSDVTITVTAPSSSGGGSGGSDDDDDDDDRSSTGASGSGNTNYPSVDFSDDEDRSQSDQVAPKQTPSQAGLTVSQSDLDALGVDSPEDILVDVRGTAEEVITADTNEYIFAIQAFITVLPDEERDAVIALMDRVAMESDSSVSVRRETLRLENKNEPSKTTVKTRYSMVFEAKEDAELVRKVVFIPKDVAASVQELTFPNKVPNVIADDPVIEFLYTNVKAGDVLEATYIINTDVDPANEPLVKTTQVIRRDAPPGPIPEAESQSRWLLWVLIILAVVLVGAFIYRKVKA